MTAQATRRHQHQLPAQTMTPDGGARWRCPMAVLHASSLRQSLLLLLLLACCGAAARATLLSDLQVRDQRHFTANTHLPPADANLPPANANLPPANAN